MESGQPPHFIWNREGEKYWRFAEGERLELWSENGRLACTPGFEEYVHGFLRLGDDLPAIHRAISTDERMACAVKHCGGLRITKSDPWEALVCFVCSQNNNIPRIRKMVQSLMRDGEVMTPEEMARADLSASRLGYREKFLRGCAAMAPSYDFDALARMPYADAHAAIIEFPGVGPKVADCTLLFGLGFLEAFPVDVWVSRVMGALYGAKDTRDARRIAEKKWGAYAGYAQQYLFCFGRDGACPMG